jgi:hypothetical protein
MMCDSQQARIIVLTGKKRGEEFLIPGGSSTIGRTKDADIVIKDKSISRIHARFDSDGSRITIADMGSKNGIRVNNRKVDAFTLHTGDVVGLGNIKMKFVDPSESGEGAAPRDAAAAPALAPEPPPAAPGPPAPSPGPAPVPGGEPAPDAAPVGQYGQYVPPAERGQGPSEPSAFAAPDGFYEAGDDTQDKEEVKTQATLRTLWPYIAVIAVAGVGLAFLVYQTFKEEYKPFEEHVKLAVGQVKLLDLIDHSRIVRGAQRKLRSESIAGVKYNPGPSILRVSGLSLGNTELAFVDPEDPQVVLGTVGIHVLSPQESRAVDYSVFTDDQLVEKALDFLRQGDSLGMPHLPDALRKYEEAVKIYNLLPDAAEGKSDAMEKWMKFKDEREKKFTNLKNTLKQAMQLDKSKARWCLAKIMELFPDEASEHHQQARIYFDRLRKTGGKKK